MGKPPKTANQMPVLPKILKDRKAAILLMKAIAIAQSKKLEYIEAASGKQS
jgi:hypothetical protein